MNDDLISRQAAVEALEAKKDKSSKGDMGCFYNTIIQNDIDALKGLPSVQPKRKRGYKINQHQYPAKWVCSECGAKHFDFSDNFCSQCGADMRGEEHNADISKKVDD